MRKASDSPDSVSAIVGWLSQGLTDETGDGRWVPVRLGRRFSRVFDVLPAFFLTAWKIWGVRTRHVDSA
jgi:hypothetical protein